MSTFCVVKHAVEEQLRDGMPRRKGKSRKEMKADGVALVASLRAQGLDGRELFCEITRRNLECAVPTWHQLRPRCAAPRRTV